MTVHIITRKAWGAKPSPLQWRVFAPVPYVFLSFMRSKLFVDHAIINDQVSKCCCVMQYLQDVDMKHLGLKMDIKYNFIAGEDGNIYEGRGFSKTPTLPRRFNLLNNHSILIGMMGNFSWRRPPDRMFEAVTKLIDYGVRSNHIKPKHLQFHL